MRSPVTVQIDAAIDLLESHGEPVTVKAVIANVKSRLTWADWSPEQALDALLNLWTPRRMKARGYAIAVRESGERKNYWNMPLSEYKAAQRKIKSENVTHVSNRLRCDDAVIAFLEEKQADFGYEVYPGLFHAEVDRIYAMHSLTPPWGKAPA